MENIRYPYNLLTEEYIRAAEQIINGNYVPNLRQIEKRVISKNADPNILKTIKSQTELSLIFENLEAENRAIGYEEGLIKSSILQKIYLTCTNKKEEKPNRLSEEDKEKLRKFLFPAHYSKI